MVWPVHISDTVPAVIRGTVRRAVDIVLPPRCLGCGALVGEPGAVCPSCWSGIDFITAPMCHCCGLPFDYDEGPDAICGDCARRPPLYGHARSAMIYNDASRRLVLAFKHSDRTDAAPAWGPLVVPRGERPAGGGGYPRAGAVAPPPADCSAVQPGRADGAGAGVAIGFARGSRCVVADPCHTKPGADEPVTVRT